MKIKSLRLGTGVYFDGQHRDHIAEKDFEIKSIAEPQGFILINIRTKKTHFISIYNVAYAEVEMEEETVLNPIPELVNKEESNGPELPTTGTEDQASVVTTSAPKVPGRKRSK